MNETNETEPPIDAEFFEQILETDLANIVKKAANGSPLTKREREMIEEERTRLRKNSQPAFKLEGEGRTGRLARLTQSEIANEYDVSLRTVKGWTALGREKNDPVPLTNPAEMCAWFERLHPGRRAGDKLRFAVDRILADQANAVVEEKPSTQKAPVIIAEIPEEQKGLLAMLERHRTAEATLHQQYMTAIETGNEQRASFLMKEWSQMGEKLRALEKAAPKALEEMGVFVKKDDVMRELELVHTAIVKSFRQRLRLARVKLLKLADSDQAKWNTEIDQLVDDICLELIGSDFNEPLVLESAA